MNNRLTEKERRYVRRVKELPCSVCDAPGPSEAHHTQQGNQYTTVALCHDCHRGSILGWHGEKRMWAIKKMTMNDALDVTLRRISETKEAA